MLDLRIIQGELEYESVIEGNLKVKEAIDKLGIGGSKGAIRLSKMCEEGTHETLLEVYISNIEQWRGDREEKAKKLAAQNWGQALPFLEHIEADQAACIAIRVILDGAAQEKMVNTVAIEIGSAIQDHLHLLNLETEHPGRYGFLIDELKQKTIARHRNAVVHRIVSKYGADDLEWTNTNKLHLGMILIELFKHTADVIDIWEDGTGSDTPLRVKFNPWAAEWIELANQRFQPVHKPMVYPPREWRGELTLKEDGKQFFQITGGYRTEALYRAKMIKTRAKGQITRLAAEDLSAVFGAVNAVQATPWRINGKVLGVMEELWKCAHPRSDPERLFTDESLPEPSRHAWMGDDSLPKGERPKPETPEQTSQLNEWRRRTALIKEHNNQARAKKKCAGRQLAVARNFKDYEQIWFPHYLDFRGRVYPFASYLNPQSNDNGKGLLMFADGKPLGERGMYWLQVHLAGCFGVDKVSFDDRVKWVQEHRLQILESASNPLDGSRWWADAEKPWQALAACFEMAGAWEQGPDFVSHIPMAQDGSCSGLQHYSAMLRDPDGGAEVNLVPREKPGDIYSKVAKCAQNLSDGSTYGTMPDEKRLEMEHMRDAWKGKVVRKIAKQPTMTLCYGSTQKGMEGQILSALMGMKPDDRPQGVKMDKAATYMAGIVWKAIGKEVKAARGGMDFLKGCTRLLAKASLPVTWKAPNGFRVEQQCMKIISKRVKIHFQGQLMYLTVAEIDEKALDPFAQTNGVAPNFVHSLDSSHLMATVNRGFSKGLQSWAVIHDSFAVHARDTDALNEVIRETFVEQYTPDLLEKFRAGVVEQLSAHPKLQREVPLLPAKGILDLEAVKAALYFFA